MQINVLDPASIPQGLRPETVRRIKESFVTAEAAAGGDPLAGLGGGGMPPMDPAAMGGGGMPPMDPAAMGGGMPPMDPAAMGGGMPPMDPAMAAGGGMPPAVDPLEQRLVAIEQQLASGGAGGAAGAATLKPKVDVNVAITQVLKILARIADTLGVQIPASEMVVTPPDLMQTANQTQGVPSGGGAGGIQPIAPLDPLQGGGGGGGGEKSSQVSVMPVSRSLDNCSLSAATRKLITAMRI